MPRTARKKSSTNIHHVVIRGIDHQLMFEFPQDFSKYIEVLSYYKERFHFELYAFCLMSNHIHIIINTKNESLSTIFHHINTRYSLWFNMKYNRIGHLQQERYYSEPIEDDRYLLTAIKYIHYNPFKAGLEEKVGTAYPWNSYHDYFSIESTLVDTKKILSLYGDISGFILHHSTPPTSCCLDVDSIRKRLPDDVAREIILAECNCVTTHDFSKLSIQERDQILPKLHKKGISIRQLNRLTGIPKGVISRILSRTK